jgi:hypothetical protein
MKKEIIEQTSAIGSNNHTFVGLLQILVKKMVNLGASLPQKINQ